MTKDTLHAVGAHVLGLQWHVRLGTLTSLVGNDQVGVQLPSGWSSESRKIIIMTSSVAVWQCGGSASSAGLGKVQSLN
jgi:hypothetical protein